MTSSYVNTRNNSDSSLQQSVSVIVAAHTEDRWDDIVNAVGSALVQEPPPLEVILVIDHNRALVSCPSPTGRRERRREHRTARRLGDTQYGRCSQFRRNRCVSG